MTRYKSLIAVAALLSALGLAACEDANDGQFEQLGEAADEATQDVKNAAEEAANDLQRAAEDAQD